MPCNPRDSAVQGQEVALQIQYFDVCGDKVMADDTPSVQISDLDGNIILASTNENVDHLGDGLYQYIYRVDPLGDAGLWTDDWNAVIDESPLSTSFIFTVISPSTGLSANTGPGKVSLADDVVFDFSPEEIVGVNILLKYLKSRLRSTGKKPVRDINGSYVLDDAGEIVTEACNVFEDEILICFLLQALHELNSTPFFTAYLFSDDLIKTTLSQLVVEGSFIFAIASQSLVEKGREFQISDGGVSYQPPQLADFLSSTYGTWLSSYREKLKFVKNSIRPGPRGYGTHTNLGGSSPAYTRLRHLRARRIV